MIFEQESARAADLLRGRSLVSSIFDSVYFMNFPYTSDVCEK